MGGEVDGADERHVAVEGLLQLPRQLRQVGKQIVQLPVAHRGGSSPSIVKAAWMARVSEVGVAVGRHRREGEQRPAVLGREQLARHRHDRAGVHAAAEHRSHRPDGAQPAAHRLGEHLEKRLGVRLVGGQAKLRPGLQRPVPPLPHPVGRDGHRVGRRQAEDLLEERARLVDALELVDEEVGDARLVDPVGRLGQHQNRARLGGEGEEAPGAVVVVERAHAHVVAGAEQPVVGADPRWRRRSRRGAARRRPRPRSR